MGQIRELAEHWRALESQLERQREELGELEAEVALVRGRLEALRGREALPSETKLAAARARRDRLVARVGNWTRLRRPKWRPRCGKLTRWWTASGGRLTASPRCRDSSRLWMAFWLGRGPGASSWRPGSSGWNGTATRRPRPSPRATGRRRLWTRFPPTWHVAKRWQHSSRRSRSRLRQWRRGTRWLRLCTRPSPRCVEP